MSDLFWSPELQNRLKQTRLNAGISADELARCCALSLAQLTQLEEGGDSKFYSQKIKFRSGVKALSALVSAMDEANGPFNGLPPPATTHTTPPESFNDSAHQRLDRVAQNQPIDHRQVAHKAPSSASLSSRLYLLGAILMSCFALLLIFEYDSEIHTYLKQEQKSPPSNGPSVAHETPNIADK